MDKIKRNQTNGTLASRTVIVRDYEEMSRRSAQVLAQVVAQKPDALLCLAAGQTAIRTYELLAEWQQAGKVDFGAARFVALDEWLDLDDERDNCAAFMDRHFYHPLRIREQQQTRFDVHAPDLQAECRRIDRAIFEGGGIDCVLLGLGMNGHLGLNEPGCGFDDYAKVVVLDPVTAQVGQKYFSRQTRLTRGITLGIGHIREARRVVLQVSGSHKAQIVRRIYETPATDAVPATVMQLLPQGIVVLDEDAASQLDTVTRGGEGVTVC